MSELVGRDLRASDAERERAVERIREAVAQGCLQLSELEERLDAAYRATTRGDLERVTRDLPEPDGRGALVVDEKPTSRSAIAVFGGFDRAGEWVVPERFVTVSVFGGGRVDLSRARFTARETRVYACALWGGGEIVVPEDVEVEVRGFGFFGMFGKGARRRAAPGAPRIVIRGFAIFGGIDTRVRRPKKKPRER
ncbi:DUF1707 domain-containing protein [Streptomyces sp. RFCAC02]|uniref:DUF1707 SHOCT-like domain-containing protein n=1 Tax=Streptomyces sp. RFCAC02 TaxID=2499143 RepID=UPI001021346C|nr:DUF1707 domain-containing protein [Streptomyces sp. RFCAC02]